MTASIPIYDGERVVGGMEGNYSLAYIIAATNGSGGSGYAELVWSDRLSSYILVSARRANMISEVDAALWIVRNGLDLEDKHAGLRAAVCHILQKQTSDSPQLEQLLADIHLLRHDIHELLNRMNKPGLP